MELNQRPFAGEDDFERVVALRRAIAARIANAPISSIDDLRDHYLQPFPGWTQQFRLWESADDLVAIGEIMWPDEVMEPRVLYVRPRIHPDAEAMVVGPQIIAWAETEAVNRFGPGITVEASVLRESTAIAAMLESLGYGIARIFERMERPATDQPPGIDAAPGYRIRPLHGEDEVDAWLALYHASFQDHFDFHPFHRDARIKEMRRETQVPELDLVAEAADESLASFCWTTRSVGDDGAVRWEAQLIGTAREHRRRGLASALLTETIRRIAALGGGTIDLTVDSSSETGANRVYERLGFATVSATLDYRREVGEPRSVAGA